MKGMKIVKGGSRETAVSGVVRLYFMLFMSFMVNRDPPRIPMKRTKAANSLESSSKRLVAWRRARVDQNIPNVSSGRRGPRE
jgi:hypothetical protein